MAASPSIEAAERHGRPPQVIAVESADALDHAICQAARACLSEGFESVAVLCKTTAEAQALYSRLAGMLDVRLIGTIDQEVQKGVLILPVHLAKGLEFDAVIVHDAGAAYYSSDTDRKLLYIACTRALHRLTLYYTGSKSPFL